MGNQIALRAHLTQPPHAVLCDHRAHILEWEAGGVASLSGALVKGVIPRNGTYLTLEDIKENVVLSDDVHACPTKVISLENTLGGTIMPLNETKRISSFAKENDIKLHLDGARLWEAVVAGAGSLPAYTSLFDSVSLCFSKGLGAPIGSMLVSNTSFIKQARWIRKSIGGGLRQAGVVTAAARVAVDETFGKGPNGEGGLLGRSQENARRIAERWERLGGRLSQRTETNMVWLDLEGAGVGGKEFVIRGEEVGLRFMGGRLVVHYREFLFFFFSFSLFVGLGEGVCVVEVAFTDSAVRWIEISEDAIERLDKLMTKLLSSTKSHSLPSNGGKELKEAAERNMNIEVE